MNAQIAAFKQKALEKMGLAENKDIEVFSFGNTPQMADELGKLVWEGKKTGTSSGYDLYTAEEEKPAAADLSIVVNSGNQPLCMIRNTTVEVLAYKDVTVEQAFKEGEGDRSLAYWRKVHWEFFTAAYAKERLEFTEDRRIIYETFQVVYR